MAATTNKTSREKENIFDEDITSLYELDLPEPKHNAYDIQVLSIHNEDEQYMLNAFHQQYVAVEGRSAIAQLIDTRIGEVATHSSFVMASTMENIDRIESAAHVGRFGKKFQDFDNKLLDQLGKNLLMTDGVAVRTMQEDMRRPVYKPPTRPKKKGAIQGFFEFLFGEP